MLKTFFISTSPANTPYRNFWLRPSLLFGELIATFVSQTGGRPVPLIVLSPLLISVLLMPDIVSCWYSKDRVNELFYGYFSASCPSSERGQP